MWKFFSDLLNQIKALLFPSQFFSWQMVIYLALFSWVMSWLAVVLGATQFTVVLLTTFSWLFLALGVGWAVDALGLKLFGLPLAPWVAGAVVCLFLFGTWQRNAFALALVVWPLLSFLIIAVPNFVGWNFNFKVPPPAVRQSLILVFFASLLLSCWFQFYFRLQAWIQDYPSVVADNLSGSEFVFRIPGYTVPLSPGVTYLTAAEDVLKSEISGKPWPWVERWLLNLQDQQQAVEQLVGQRLAGTTLEQSLWTFDIYPQTSGNGYALKLWAIWNGPSANATGYYLEKSCLLLPVAQMPANSAGLVTPNAATDPQSSTVWANLTCDLETPRQNGHPTG